MSLSMCARKLWVGLLKLMFNDCFQGFVRDMPSHCYARLHACHRKKVLHLCFWPYVGAMCQVPVQEPMARLHKFGMFNRFQLRNVCSMSMHIGMSCAVWLRGGVGQIFVVVAVRVAERVAMVPTMSGGLGHWAMFAMSWSDFPSHSVAPMVQSRRFCTAKLFESNQLGLIAGVNKHYWIVYNHWVQPNPWCSLQSHVRTGVLQSYADFGSGLGTSFWALAAEYVGPDLAPGCICR